MCAMGGRTVYADTGFRCHQHSSLITTPKGSNCTAEAHQYMYHAAQIASSAGVCVHEMTGFMHRAD